MEKSLHCIVTGKVQGVFFRSFVQEHADSLGLTGWVRNLQEGKVEVLAQGSEENLKTLKERLLQGPPLAQVHNVEANWTEYDKSYHGFEIRG
ncbi:MAG: acylphosphatase [Thermodesulfobacteriota bacterium]|nr:acylphosphatase [Desulfovibrio sp.]